MEGRAHIGSSTGLPQIEADFVQILPQAAGGARAGVLAA
jgi:hypothetical protein